MGQQSKLAPALALLNYRPNCGLKLLAIAPPVTPAWNDTAHNKAFMSHDPDQSLRRHAPNRR
uniref:Uncharacterized protein n=1 Tax=Aegilops tauschii subsp. strangulata TaxID=200361 RepID=A0A453FTA9_AEGTS